MRVQAYGIQKFFSGDKPLDPSMQGESLWFMAGCIKMVHTGEGAQISKGNEEEGQWQIIGGRGDNILVPICDISQKCGIQKARVSKIIMLNFELGQGTDIHDMLHSLDLATAPEAAGGLPPSCKACAVPCLS
jgi:hypothetical protein